MFHLNNTKSYIPSYFAYFQDLEWTKTEIHNILFQSFMNNITQVGNGRMYMTVSRR